MKIIPRELTPVITTLKVGDIVVYKSYGTHIVLEYGISVRQYGLVNLVTGNWSCVSNTLREVADKITQGGERGRVTSNDSWTLTEDDA